MRLVITTDAVGGVWTYTRELTTELARRSHEVNVVCFGPSPTGKQCDWLKDLPRVTFQSRPFKLEWMAECESDVQAASTELARIVDEFKPDLLHSNQFCFGALEVKVPRVVVAHSDVVSWWHAVQGCEPDPRDFPHIDWYRETVSRGMSQAQATVAISQDVRSSLENHYGAPRRCELIYNGLHPARFVYDRKKQDHALCVGRFWDKAKNLVLLEKISARMPIRIAGDERELGVLDTDALREEYANASVYVHPALYEPFGLAPLEAAFSGCALLLADIASLREIWGEHAEYFDPRNSNDLARKLEHVAGTRGAREHALEHYTAERMTDEYESLYRELVGSKAVAA